MIFAKHELGFNFNNDEASYKTIKACKNYPEDFYYEIFVLAKSTKNKQIRTECANIIKKQAPEALQLAFKSRKKITLVEDSSSFNNKLIAILEYGVLSEDLDLCKLYTLVCKRLSLSIKYSKKEVVQLFIDTPRLLSQFNGIKELTISTFRQKEGFSSVVNNITQLTSLEKLELEIDYKYMPEELERLVNLKEFILAAPNLVWVPVGITKLKSLKKLEFRGGFPFGNDEPNPNIVNFTWLTELTSLKHLRIGSFTVQDLSAVELPASLKKLEFFRLENITALPETLGHLPKLKKLRLSGMESLEHFPASVSEFKKLEVLEVTHLSKLKKVPASFIFGPNIKRLLGLYTEFMPYGVTPVTKLKRIVFTNPELLSFVLDNALSFTNLKEIEITCEAPQRRSPHTFSAFKKLKNLKYKLAHHLEWVLEDIHECEKLEDVFIYGIYSGADAEITNADVVNFPQAFSRVKHLQTLRVHSAKALVLNTDYLPINTDSLTITDIKVIEPGVEYFEVNHIKVVGTPITALQKFYSVIRAKKIKLDDVNSVKNETLDFDNFKDPESFKDFIFNSNVKGLDKALKTLCNLQSLTIDFNKDNAEQNNGLTAYTHHNLKNLTIKNFNGNTNVIKLLLEHTPNLEFLEIYECVGLADLPKVTLNKLKTLKLFYSDDIQSIENLTVPNIELIKVLFCDNFGYDAMVTASHWKTLKFLWLEHISKDLEIYPETIADLNLDTFFIDGFLTKRQIPKWIGRMKSLRVLGIESFKYSPLPEELAELTQLKIMSIRRCDFTEQVSDKFKNLNLEDLIYRYSKFNGNNMKSSKSYALAGNKILKEDFDNRDEKYNLYC
ncbi:leucine-rich repeat domain-containing protein [Psychroserpens sp. NJDZ02]|uniref:leucine-rich repeat domain-containing protein n=1 Tax=Psychroserpens sp. NJDZ02 TaxID=2570561 RepID=UPI0010A86310|nr:hypothetical protein [Psychroserpens sp. NJDZ02]QCE41811.1 hypothetical protein E9099_10450 [Psychroserpens sp. NJDZ02]